MAEHGWVGVDEYMPTMKVRKSSADYLMSDYVLVWDGLEVGLARAVSDESGLYWVDRCAEVVKVAAWMPLPTPPEQY